MKGHKALIHAFVAAALTVAAGAQTATTHPVLSAEEVARKNVAARGGLQAWRGVQTLEMTGKMQAGGNNRPVLPIPGTASSKHVAPPRSTEQAELPFTLELKRPLKMRLELQFAGKTALQVYDGSNGWKLRPYLNRLEVEPYTQEETKAALSQSELDGPLVDYQAKGTKLEYAGLEKVEGRDTYKLKMTFKNGEQKSIWIDADTFLDAKIEGNQRRLDGTYHPVYIYYRDFREVNGLKIPYVLETRVELARAKGPATEIAEQITISDVKVNPKLEDALFIKPQIKSSDVAQAHTAPAAVAPSTTAPSTQAHP
jgi:hypothetical protein